MKRKKESSAFLHSYSSASPIIGTVTLIGIIIRYSSEIYCTSKCSLQFVLYNNKITTINYYHVLFWRDAFLFNATASGRVALLEKVWINKKHKMKSWFARPDHSARRDSNRPFVWPSVLSPFCSPLCALDDNVINSATLERGKRFK